LFTLGWQKLIILKQTRKEFMQIPQTIKYFLLTLIGLGIIVCCSLFQHIATVAGEYHYSHFLMKNYLTIPTATIFFLVSIAIGYYWRLNPWLSGLCFFFIFPLTSIIEETVYVGSHNLIPFEFIGFFIFSLPAVVGVYLGRLLFNKYQNEK
jgi:hypothetical protein